MCTWGSIKAASCARVLRRPYKTILAHNLVYMQVSDDIGADSTLEGGSLRRFCPSGMRSRRSSSPARGTSPIPGRACSCWTSRGGCSASRGSERHTAILRDRARRAAPARETPSPYGRPKATDLPFTKQVYRAREAIELMAKLQPIRQLMGKPPETTHFSY